MDGIEHFSLTDGQCWDVYETRKRGNIDEKRIVSFDLKDQPPAEVCLQALALWRPAVEAGHVAAGVAPVILSDDHPDSQSRTIPDPNPPLPDPPASEWQSLSDWNPKQGDDQPVEIMFPDGSQTATENWYSVAAESAHWLVKRNFLTRDHCPITEDNRGKRNLVTDTSISCNIGVQMPTSKSVYFTDVKYNGFVHAQNARTIIKHVGQDPAQFKVLFR